MGLTGWVSEDVCGEDLSTPSELSVLKLIQHALLPLLGMNGLSSNAYLSKKLCPIKKYLQLIICVYMRAKVFVYSWCTKTIIIITNLLKIPVASCTFHVCLLNFTRLPQ